MKNTFVPIKLQELGTMIEDALIAAHIKFLSIKSQKGTALIEYGLVAALISVVAITGLKAVGTDLNTLFNTNIASQIP
jgi:Flp pilus assembly pilin Flp